MIKSLKTLYRECVVKKDQILLMHQFPSVYKVIICSGAGV